MSSGVEPLVAPRPRHSERSSGWLSKLARAWTGRVVQRPQYAVYDFLGSFDDVQGIRQVFPRPGNINTKIHSDKSSTASEDTCGSYQQRSSRLPTPSSTTPY